MSAAMTGKLGAALAAALGVVLVSGCGPTMRDVPLPGSGVSGDTITVKVQFDEALNLAQGAVVKVNGVSSGKVQSVSTKDFKAIAVLKVRTSAEMRAAATARLRYTTPLGELFVDVSNPAQGDLIRDGQELAKENAGTAPTVEDSLASASLLINGGGLNQLQTVTEELTAAVVGREDDIRDLLNNADTFLSEANATTGDIDAALRALAGLSQVLNANKSTINAALTQVAPAAKILRQNTPEFTALLAKLAEFSGTANDVVGKTRTQILQMVNQVGPVLDEFLSTKDQLGPSFDALVNVSKVINAAVPGDYVNMYLTIEIDKIGLPNIFGPGIGASTSKPAAASSGLSGSSGAGTPGSTSGGASSGSGVGILGQLLNGLLGGGRK